MIYFKPWSSTVDQSVLVQQVAGIVGDGTVFICSQTISDTIAGVCITLAAAIGRGEEVKTCNVLNVLLPKLS